MKILDLNLLIYAIHDRAPNHPRAKRWLESTLSGEASVGLAWIVILGFLRITTNPRVFDSPLTPERALTIVEGWLTQPCVEVVAPRENHWEVLRHLVSEAGTAGNLTTDAHLAALAIERGAELCSTDPDFARFSSLRWVNPLA